jgi:single-strand DNA-binding protein
MSLNKVMLIGNVGKDPEVRHLESGAATASFTLATTERYKDRNGENKEQTEWHNIVCWRALADLVEKYVKKGTQLYIEGRIRTRSYNDKEGNVRYITEINADTIQLLGKKSDNPGSGSYTSTQTQTYVQPVTPKTSPIISPEDLNNGDDTDDLPF